MNVPVALLKNLTETGLEERLASVIAQSKTAFEVNHGDLRKWQNVIARLPELKTSLIDLNSPVVTIGGRQECSDAQRDGLGKCLKELMPWRKGPFDIFGIRIETEWRSDWKWQRLENHITSLQDRVVLDVGCGSGYHCLRMAGCGAKFTIGIEPGLLYVMQFYSIHHFARQLPVFVLPLTLEALTAENPAFDTVFSMGVLYHRRSPLDHLLKLKKFLRPQGELVLETLILDRSGNDVLVPEGRYANMRNVWFIPSVSALTSWLKRCGFNDIRCVDVTRTTVAEQRSTAWMNFESLQQALNPADSSLTVEGLPAPCRAIFICNKP
jgi:tRNA (mo5U34)-methyltransferase